VVIGSGPGGYVAAIKAAQLGMKVGQRFKPILAELFPCLISLFLVYQKFRKKSDHFSFGFNNYCKKIGNLSDV